MSETPGEVRIRHLDVCGFPVRCATRPGDAARTPLLMLNGMGAPLEFLAPLAERLGGIETIAFDVPGTGESPIPQFPYTLPQMAILARSVLSELGYGRVDVFGLSWGGMLAQQFAFQYPDRCRRLVLAASMPGAPMVPGRWSSLMKLATPRRFNDPDYARSIAGEVYGGAARSNPVPALDRPGRYVSPVGYLLQQLAVTGWSSLPILPLLRQPTLVMAGDDDPIVPLVNAKWMARLIPRGRLHVVHDGHHFFRSSIDETSATIVEFLGAGPQDPNR